MDSPLLPTLRNASFETSLLADMTLSSPPGSPLLSRPLPPHASTSTSTSNQSGTSSSRQRSTSPHRPSLRFDDSLEAEEDDNDPTPQKRKQNQKQPRFSLFAPPPLASSSSLTADNSKDQQRSTLSSSQDEGERVGDRHDGHSPVRSGLSSAARDEKLRESLYELREMNNVFEGFLGALEDARGHNQRLSLRVTQTSTLLDEYTLLLSQTEHTQKLLLNPQWTGAEDDALHITRVAEQAEEAARAIVAATAAAEAEAEERERLIEEKREREREGRGSVGTGAGAGPRGRGGGGGTGARGAGAGRGSVGGGVRGRGGGTVIGSTTGIPRPSVGTGLKGGSGISGGTSVKRPPSAGGKYADVKSSGYGPPGKRS